MILHYTSLYFLSLPTGRLFATTGRLGDVAVHTVTPGSVAGMGDYSRWTVPAQALSPALHLRLSPAAPCYSAIPRHPTPPHATPRHPTPPPATSGRPRVISRRRSRTPRLRHLVITPTRRCRTACPRGLPRSRGHAAAPPPPPTRWSERATPRSARCTPYRATPPSTCHTPYHATPPTMLQPLTMLHPLTLPHTLTLPHPYPHHPAPGLRLERRGQRDAHGRLRYA